ncbi:Transposon Tf2-8 polyprotein [Labeo rohita]|uniref:Gypsy retrotransposon integrase-like protein 1 n=1 Tax=Labeo rohita TaxID=84645 RepID=A0ABQ8L715_LABRO|nr:Transposon Tf2-8 polyprotein [Labeo rohita]
MAEITEAQQLEPAPPKCPPERTYVPAPLRQRLLSLIHENPSAGHPGILATQELVGNKFWWPSMNQQITSFVKDCVVCNQIKSQHQRPAGLFQPLPIPERPWSHLAVDFVTDLPPSNHNTTVLTIIDRFSKACRFIPLPKLPTAWETAQILLHQVFRFYGLPEDIVSDRGPQFTSRVWRPFCAQLNNNVSLTSGYHPQSNGQVERLNQELTKFRAYCYLKQSDWSDYIVWAEYAQNFLKKPSNHLTPFQCILGFQPPLFPWSGETTNLPTVDSWLRRSEAIWDATHASLQSSASPPLQEIKSEPAVDPGGEGDQDEAAPAETPPLVPDDEDIYQVNQILDSRRRGGLLQYLVDWEGYGPEERSWVSAKDILDPQLTTNFHQDHPEKLAPHPRGRPRRQGAARFRSRSQGRGSVTNSASVALSAQPQREPSPAF